MKSILCLLIAAGFGALLQFQGVPHGLLLGSIVVTALFASKTGIAPATPMDWVTSRSRWASPPG
ncbi:hypothetical protein RCC30_17425 [Pseudomonas fluorescens]|nr:hypothetical protein RCC30_17425 [Pseudomonas fluorescens]